MGVPFQLFYIFSCIISACCCLPLKEICMEELGCFRITEDFISEYRVVNVLPQPLSVLKTVFYLYTRKNPEKPQVISYKSPSSIASSHFNSSHETKILIHGYLDDIFFSFSWTKRMKHELLLFQDMNVILVDCHRGKRFPYTQAVANARVIGAEIARLIQVMEDTTSTRRTLFHLIGHSLGSHTAGYAGKRLVNLSRITALDPSGPLFQNMPPSVRLDKTDADFVDVIHTDKMKTTDDIYLWLKDYFTLKRLGMSHLQGDIDIFLNDGTDQPGCDFSQPLKSTDAMLTDFAHLWACDHLRAVDFMIYSINLSNVLPVAYQCRSWEEFLKGRCADCGKSAKKCVVVGLRAEKNKVFRYKTATPFYIKTSGTNPFWIYHYQLELKVLKANSTGHAGRIALTLKGSENRETFHLNNNLVILLLPGKVLDFLITTEKRLGNLLSLSLKWSPFKQTSNLTEKSSKIIEYITVTMMNIIEKTPRKESKKMFCGDPSGSFFQVC